MIKLENVTFRYEGAEKDTLTNINLNIRAGECVVLTGSSGCGKTTLTRLLNGLIPHFYPGTLKGTVSIEGNYISNVEPHQLSSIVGSVFQNPRTQFFNTDTNSEIVFGMENCGISYERMHQKFYETVNTLQLQSLCNRDIFALSGGEKQSIAFGSVYALSPMIYVLDEPSANLDCTAINLLGKVMQILKQQGKTILIAEHRLYYLKNVVDRIMLMEQGEIRKEFKKKQFASLSLTELHGYGLRTLNAIKIPLTESDFRVKSPAIEVRNLSVRYKNRKKPVFQEVNITIGRGELVGMTGSNGLGKTTLARTICGLVKECRGQVFINGEKVEQKKRNLHTFLVMQDPNYQLFCDSVKAELEMSSSGEQQKREDIMRFVQELDLEDVLMEHPLSLSGGQKQRICIALAALSKAEVLVFDEPTSGLDFCNMRRVSVMLHMLAKCGKAILVISHDSEFLEQACTRILTLKGNNNG